ncbi:death-associated protein-like 1 [Arapaima gigas]
MVRTDRGRAGARAELRAGHAPAVKAGGKRVTKKSNEESGAPDRETKRPPEKTRSLATLPRAQLASVLLAGTLEKLGHDFPATPASVRHSKLRPSMEKTHSPRVFFIQQPRKC